MTDLLLDVWNDLREKRLAPVAVLLAVGLVAVPLLLGGGGSSAEPAPAAAPASQPKQQAPLVKAAEEGKGEGSDLGVFDPKDPFEPAVKPPAPGSGTATVAEPEEPSGNGGGSSGEEKAAPEGGVPDVEGAPGPTPAAPPSEGRKSYTWVADVRFGRAGRERRRRGLTRLTILPSARNPLLVFMGVTADRKRAVFLLDSTSSQAGEGSCKPSGSTCSFLYLSAGDDKDQHFFTDSAGRDYGLHLLRLRRREVRSAKASRAKASRRRGARHRKPAAEASSLFHLPVLIDEETSQ
jgi:hypothetical protein